MNPKFPFLALIFIFSAGAMAQVASHAPTAVRPAAPSSSPSGKPVARVNGAVLTDVDLVREEYAIFPYARQHNGEMPKELAGQIRDGALKMIVFEELVYQEALRRNMTVPPARMQRAQAEFHKQFSSPDEFNAFVQHDFQGSQKLLDDKIRRSLLIEALLKLEVDRKSEVTPVELRAYYQSNIARFRHAENFTFQTISVLPPANVTAEQLKEGRARIDRAFVKAKAAKTSEEFGMLAEKMSDDDYRVVMGQHKPVDVDQLAAPVLKALRTMKPGDVSDVIQLDQAFTIVRLQQHSPAGTTPFEQVKAQLTKELHEKKRNQIRIDFDKKLRQTAKVEEM
jgi:hypothetical protein